MFALKEKSLTTTTYNLQMDRFAAVSFVIQMNNRVAERAAEIYKSDYLSEFKRAYIDYMRIKKGFYADDERARFMDSHDDVEGFEMAFNADFFEPIATIDVYELNSCEAMVYPRFGNFGKEYDDMIVNILKAEATVCETEINEEFNTLPGMRVCSFPVNLDVERLLTDEERDDLRAKAKDISEQSLFTL